MEAKQKAQELVKKFEPHAYGDGDYSTKHHSKQCALIAVDEIIKVADYSQNLGVTNTDVTNEYWQEVKRYINEL